MIRLIFFFGKRLTKKLLSVIMEKEKIEGIGNELSEVCNYKD